MKKEKRFIGVIFFIIIFFGFSYFLFNIIPFSNVIESIGFWKYLILPLISIFGNNLFTSSFLYPVLILLHQDGMDFVLLVLLVTIGATFGDLIFVFLGREIHDRSKKKKEIFTFFKKHRNSNYISLFIFLYAALVPLSNEFMTFALGYIEYPFRKTIIPLFLGNILYFSVLIWVGGTILGLLF